MMVYDWKRIVRSAWSVRFAALAAFFSAIEMALPIFFSDLPRGLFMGLAFVASLGGLVSRIVSQPKMYRGKR